MREQLPDFKASGIIPNSQVQTVIERHRFVCPDRTYVIAVAKSIRINLAPGGPVAGSPDLQASDQVVQSGIQRSVVHKQGFQLLVVHISKAIGHHGIPGGPVAGAPELRACREIAGADVERAAEYGKSTDVVVAGRAKAARVDLCPGATVAGRAAPDFHTSNLILDGRIQRAIKSLKTAETTVVNRGVASGYHIRPTQAIAGRAAPNLCAIHPACAAGSHVQRVTVDGERADGTGTLAQAIARNLVPGRSVR